jgi:hypothetical protein
MHVNKTTDNNNLLTDILNEMGNNTYRPIFSAGSLNGQLSANFGGSVNFKSIPTDNAFSQYQ